MLAPGVPLGYRVEAFGTVNSTNDVAFAKCKGGDRGPLWILAAEQTTGRGRSGRSWVTVPGNLFTSLLLVQPCEAARAAELGFVAGTALATASEALAGNGRLRLKWPNDLVDAAGAKVSGLLVEAKNVGGRLAVVLGFGVNCVAAPSGLGYPTSCLSVAAGRLISREEAFSALATAAAQALDVWRAGGFGTVRERWLAACAGLGEPIRVTIDGETRQGVFETIDSSGRLVLATSGGRQFIQAGDVSLRLPMVERTVSP